MGAESTDEDTTDYLIRTNVEGRIKFMTNVARLTYCLRELNSFFARVPEPSLCLPGLAARYTLAKYL